MSQFSVRSLHPFLEQLVLCQRANRNVHDILTTIKKIIDGRQSCSVTKEEQLACQAAILLALRVTSCSVFRIILGENFSIMRCRIKLVTFVSDTLIALIEVGAESSMTTGKWSIDRTGYAAVVHACLSLDENDSDQPNLGIVKFSHIHALFSALMSNMEGPSNSILIMLQAVYDLCRAFSRINEWRNEFTSVKCVGLYGKVVSICLEVASDKENDIKCRQLALMTLESVVNISENSGDLLPIVLPGLSSTLVSIACATNENFDIVITCLKMFSKVIPICLCDGPHDNDDVSVPSDLKPEIQQLLIQKNSDWKANTIENVIKMLANILLCLNEDVSRLATSRSPVLRLIFPALAASLKVDLRRLLITRGQFGGSSLGVFNYLECHRIEDFLATLL
uniref:HEAT repeat-containing protein 6 n=1 Tax=Angiostrongylus cantonensis TaxID=6313 RepID=A0A0K0DKQ0_ANGCA